MPLYEYLCLDCRRRTTVLQLSIANPKPVSCASCGSTKLSRLMSRFASPKSEEARLGSLADSDTLGDLDESDPESMRRFMRKMGDEMGEDLGEDPSDAPGAADDSTDLEDIGGY